MRAINNKKLIQCNDGFVLTLLSLIKGLNAESPLRKMKSFGCALLRQERKLMLRFVERDYMIYVYISWQMIIVF